MREIGVLYKPDMIAAILDDRKTNTRRVIMPQPIGFGCTGKPLADNSTVNYPVRKKEIVCRYGKPGDRHYIKEPHYLFGQWCRNGYTKTGKEKWRFSYERDKGVFFPDYPPEKICHAKHQRGWFKRSPLFMPKWAARWWMEVTDVRVERVQEITEADAIAEGVVPRFRNGEPIEHDGTGAVCQEAFADLWDSINGKPRKDGIDISWKANPWVRVVAFRRIELCQN